MIHHTWHFLFSTFFTLKRTTFLKNYITRMILKFVRVTYKGLLVFSIEGLMPSLSSSFAKKRVLSCPNTLFLEPSNPRTLEPSNLVRAGLLPAVWVVR